MTDLSEIPAKSRVDEPEYVIPDDPEQSVYRFIIVAAKRARQLQSGARPKIPHPSKKATRIAIEEVRRGAIPWIDPEQQPPPEQPQEVQEFAGQ